MSGVYGWGLEVFLWFEFIVLFFFDIGNEVIWCLGFLEYLYRFVVGYRGDG